jgi:1,4-alpha-glucan branching enzyme
MLRKQKSRRKGMVHVTFTLPDSEAGSLHLLGDFNGWKPVHAMSRVDGTWKASVDLEPGRTYEFRYLADDDRWLNDPEADGYVANQFGSDNCVLET